MSTPTTDSALLPTRSVPPRQLAWLRSETSDWAAQGIISPDQADRISQLYSAEAHTRSSVGRVLLTLGLSLIHISEPRD